MQRKKFLNSCDKKLPALQRSQGHHTTPHNMNAHALLTSQGWRGTGHSLHPTSDLTGLSRPLLVSQKTNNLGVGKKQHKTSDMWWMNAFDKSLQGLDTSAQGKVVQRITNSGLDMVVKGGAKWVGGGGGLYACFVKGEVLGGTIELQKEEERSRSTREEPPKRKRKRDEGEVERESKEERRARKAAKRAARAAVEEIPAVEEKAETKERSERKRLRRKL